MRYFLFAIVLSVSVAACNVFGGLYEEGSSNEPQVLLEDARIAMQDGRVDDAVVHLEKAHQNQPENVEVRVELASALLTQNDIDVLLIMDLIDEVENGGPGKASVCPESNTCSFDCAAAKSVAPFQFKNSAEYQRLEAALAVLEKVDTLVRIPLEELGVGSGARYDTPEARRELFEALVGKIEETHPGRNARRIAATLLLDAGVATLATTITDIETAADAHEVTLYNVERFDGSTYISFCGADVDTFVSGSMCLASSSAQLTLDLLETRLENFTADSGSEVTSIASDLVDTGRELFDGLASDIENECSN